MASIIKWFKKYNWLIGVIALLIGIYPVYVLLISPYYQGQIITNPGNTKIIFGSNTFIGTPHILSVDGKPIFNATVQNGRLFIDLIIFDRDNKVVGKIEHNNWIVNQNNVFQIPIETPSEIKIIN